MSRLTNEDFDFYLEAKHNISRNLSFLFSRMVIRNVSVIHFNDWDDDNNELADFLFLNKIKESQLRDWIFNEFMEWRKL